MYPPYGAVHFVGKQYRRGRGALRGGTDSAIARMASSDEADAADGAAGDEMTRGMESLLQVCVHTAACADYTYSCLPAVLCCAACSCCTARPPACL